MAKKLAKDYTYEVVEDTSGLPITERERRKGARAN